MSDEAFPEIPDPTPEELAKSPYYIPTPEQIAEAAALIRAENEAKKGAEMEPREPMVKPTKRITNNFDNLAGKTVSRTGNGGQFFWLLFTDGTYVFLDAHNFAMNCDSTIWDFWKVEIGLMSAGELRNKREAIESQVKERRETEERKVLDELSKKYPDAA